MPQQTQNICITFVQRRPNVFDVGSTLYKCYTNVLCLLGRNCIINTVLCYKLLLTPLHESYVCPSDYLKSNQRICIKLSSEVCFEPRNNWFHFRDYSDHGLDTRSVLQSWSHESVVKSYFHLTTANCVEDVIVSPFFTHSWGRPPLLWGQNDFHNSLL